MVPDSTAVRVVALEAGAPAAAAVELDARNRSTEAGVHSEPFAVEPMTAYEIRAMVQRLAGDKRFKVAVQWQDAEHRHLGYENSWTGQLAGVDWEPHVAPVVSPPSARFARLLPGIEADTACRMTCVKLHRRPRVGPKLAVDLIAEALTGTPEHAPRLTIRLENRGDVLLTTLTCTVQLPDGLRAIEPTEWTVESLAYAESISYSLALAGRPERNDAPIRCRVTGLGDGQTVAFAGETLPFVSATLRREADGTDLPPPVAVASRVQLGCYYFPVMLDWDRRGWGVKRVDAFEPLLGYYDEALPEVADWHIRWAVEHGISVFVFDWYWNQGMDYLNDALDKGFLGSRYANRMQFCLDWCNEGHCTQFKPLDFSKETLADFIRVLCERYFRHENYLRVDGRPVVVIHQAARLANAHGGWAGCREALEGMRAIARTYGHPGVYFVALHNHAILPRYGLGGFDAVTAYAYGFCDVAWGGPDRSLPFDALIPRHDEAYAAARSQAHQQGMDYIPSGWIGWDDAPRSRERAVRSTGNTPAAFRRMLESLPRFVDERPGLALFEAWNEWGEGGAAEPGIQYGFGYLDAIRDVLTDTRGPREGFVPTPAERERLAAKFTFEQINDEYYRRHARQLGLERGLDMTFDSPRGLWLRPWSQVNDLRIADGALRGRSTGGNPQLVGPPIMDLPADRVRTVIVDLAVTAGREGRLFWTTESDPHFSADRSIPLTLTADEQAREHRLEVGSHPEWRGIIRQFRLDPTDAPAEFAIERFRTE